MQNQASGHLVIFQLDLGLGGGGVLQLRLIWNERPEKAAWQKRLPGFQLESHYLPVVWPGNQHLVACCFPCFWSGNNWAACPQCCEESVSWYIHAHPTEQCRVQGGGVK